MSKNINYYLLVDTFTEAMEIQKLMREGDIPFRITPTPHSLQKIAGCGVAVLLLPEHLEQAKKHIEANNAKYNSIIPLECQINPRRDKFV